MCGGVSVEGRAATTGQGCCPWGMVGGARRKRQIGPVGDRQTDRPVVSGGELTITQLCSRESKSPSPAVEQKVPCGGTRESREGEDRPLATCWGRTVEVLAIKSAALELWERVRLLWEMF